MVARKQEQQIQLSFEQESGDSKRMRLVSVKPKAHSETQAFNQLIANNIKAARKYAGLSQAELGELIYGSPAKNRICEFESGTTQPSILMLSKIAKQTGVSLDYIYGMSPEPLPDEYGVRHGLAMATIQEAVKPAANQLAGLLSRTIWKMLPTSGTIVLVENLKVLKKQLDNMKADVSVEQKKKASLEVIKTAENCISIGENLEREFMIKERHISRAAADAIIHDERMESGHMLMADMFDPIHRIVDED